MKAGKSLNHVFFTCTNTPFFSPLQVNSPINKTNVLAPMQFKAQLTGANNVPGAGGSPVVTDSAMRGVLQVGEGSRRPGVFAQKRFSSIVLPAPPPAFSLSQVDISYKAKAGVWTLAVAEGTNVFMSHIHLGSSTQNGNPVLALAPQFPAGQDRTLTSLAQLPVLNPPQNVSLAIWKGSFSEASFINVGAPPPTWDEFVTALRSGNLYGNVHTTASGAH